MRGRLPDLSGRAEMVDRLRRSLGPEADLPADLVERLLVHYRSLRRWNPVHGLIGRNEGEHIVARHYAESLVALPWLNPADAILDIGSGGGFPGLILAAAGMQAVLVESRAKKAAFLRATADAMGCSVTILEHRLGLPLSADLPETVDCVALRAVRLDTAVWEALAERYGPGLRALIWSGPSDPGLPMPWRCIGERSLPSGRPPPPSGLPFAGLISIAPDSLKGPADPWKSWLSRIRKAALARRPPRSISVRLWARWRSEFLLVDCDPQGNATRGLSQSGEAPNLYDVLVGEIAAGDVVVDTGFPFFHLLPTNRDLVALEVELAGESGWQRLLRDALAPLEDRYDYVLLDCPPSLGHLTVLALAAADRLLVPLQCEYFALEGISELMSTLERIREGVNPRLGIAGIVLTMYDERTNLARDVVAEIRRHFGPRVCDTIIPRNVRLAEAPSHGMTILQYDIKSRGAQAYLELAAELLRRGR